MIGASRQQRLKPFLAGLGSASFERMVGSGNEVRARSSGHRKRLVILNEYVGDTGQCKITMNICLCEVTADVVDKAEAANTALPAAPINQSLGAALSRSGFRWWWCGQADTGPIRGRTYELDTGGFESGLHVEQCR